MTVEVLKISNPKISKNEKIKSFYPYYAGFSENFVQSILEKFSNSDSLIYDPWCGSGTVGVVSAKMNVKAINSDLNPVMCVVAAARNNNSNDFLWIDENIDKVIDVPNFSKIDKDDPLLKWFYPSSALLVRNIQRNIDIICDAKLNLNQLNINEKQAFLYVILFKICRIFLKKFFSKNPTWVALPKKHYDRVRLNKEKISDLYKELYKSSKDLVKPNFSCCKFSVSHEDSCSINIEDEKVDLIITSPPYCTRIDYAVSTAIELAVLGIKNKEYGILRRKLFGNSKVSDFSLDENFLFGKKCSDFLDKVKNHSSKASAGYYYKNHYLYFLNLEKSLSELARVTKKGGIVCLVVQDSFYKEIKNDVQSIIQEMLKMKSLKLIERIDFPTRRSILSINTKSTSYREISNPTESVLIFCKE